MPYSGETRTYPDGPGNAIDSTTYYLCDHCGEEHFEVTAAEDCCQFFCEECGARHTYEEDAADCCAYFCPNCGEQHRSLDAADNCSCHDEYVDEEYVDENGRRPPVTYPSEILDTVASYPILIPEIEGRPTRLCSVEQELSAGGTIAAQLLADLGIAPDAYLQTYSHAGHAGRAIVKSDGSLPAGGGEVVYSRFNLSDRPMAREFSEAIWRIRELKKIRLVRTNRQAGMHIHISALPNNGLGEHVFGPKQMAGLYEIVSFCEDVLFRLASAGWEDHRGLHYTAILPKFPNAVTPGRIVQNIGGSRYYSLNFSRLITAAQQCRCGACAVGDWAECNCGSLSSGTIEWRYFNASTKPETIHGWLILAHSLTAKAFDYELGSLSEPNGYGDYNSTTENHQWVLGWILNECPLTDVERMVLIGLAKRSPGLIIDWEDFERSNAEWMYSLTDELDDEHDHEPQELTVPLHMAAAQQSAAQPSL